MMLTQIAFLVLAIAVVESNANCSMMDLTQCHMDYTSAFLGNQGKSGEEMKKAKCSAIDAFTKCLNNNLECKGEGQYKSYKQTIQNDKDMCGGADSAFEFSLWMSVLMVGVTMAMLC